jgi:hypothetical protein
MQQKNTMVQLGQLGANRFRLQHRSGLAGSGTQTAALAFGGSPAAPPGYTGCNRRIQWLYLGNRRPGSLNTARANFWQDQDQDSQTAALAAGGADTVALSATLK